jgi:hypothetical protein
VNSEKINSLSTCYIFNEKTNYYGEFHGINTLYLFIQYENGNTSIDLFDLQGDRLVQCYGSLIEESKLLTIKCGSDWDQLTIHGKAYDLIQLNKRIPVCDSFSGGLDWEYETKKVVSKRAFEHLGSSN